MIRYRLRSAGESNPWSEPLRLRRVLLVAKRQRRRHQGKARFRRRDQAWGRWFATSLPWRLALRTRLRRGRRGVYQFQVGGEGGPVFAVMKYSPAPTGTAGDRVLAVAATELGTPYEFGEANGPEDPGADSFDCSGLTQWAWASEGIFLPHSAALQQRARNVDLIRAEDAIDGDLVLMWFENSRGIPRGTASHVGLRAFRYGAGKMLDTRSERSPVAIRDIEWASVVAFGRPRSDPRL